MLDGIIFCRFVRPGRDARAANRPIGSSLRRFRGRHSARRKTDMLQLLAITIIAMLIYHPIDLYSAGFQLSFGVILGLVIFTRPLRQILFREDKDTQIAQSLQSSSRFSAVRKKFRDEIRFTIAAAIVAWVVAMPLIALYFEQLNPWAILASIILAPIVVVALIGGFLKIAFTILWPSFSHLWANIATYPIAGMRHTVAWLATFPGDIPLPAPPVWAVLLFYALLLALLIPWPKRLLRWSAQEHGAGGVHDAGDSSAARRIRGHAFGRGRFEIDAARNRRRPDRDPRAARRRCRFNRRRIGFNF